jgi:hypothetical protein
VNNSLCRILALLLLALSGSARFASAQEAAIQTSPYGQGVYREGPGLRLGNAALVIHPGLAVEGGYDSNVFYAPTGEVGAPILRVRAHVDLATLPPQYFENDRSSVDPKAEFRLSAQAEYREYFVNNGAVEDALRTLAVTVSGDLAILPKGPFTLRLAEVFARTVDPRNSETSCNAMTGMCVPGNYSRDFERFTASASYRFGALEVGIGDYIQVNFWETPQVQFANSWSDDGQIFGRLRAFRATVFNATLRLGYVSYWNNTQVNAVPFRALVGASQVFTEWLSGTLQVGYGNSFNLMGGSVSTPLVDAELRFVIPSKGRLTLAYNRDFSDSIFANSYADDHIYLAYDQKLHPRVGVHLDGGLRYRQYNTLVDPMLVGATGYCNGPTASCMPTTSRSDWLYDAHAELWVSARDWLAFAANYNLLGDATDFAFISGTTITPVHFIKHSVFVRIDVAY